jgi:polar amino acid transport system substrate-binding protein
MLRFPKRLLILLAALALAHPSAPAQPRLVFACDATFPPMEFLDARGDLAGFDVDLVKAVAKAGGFAAVLRNTAWDGIFAGLKAGRYDAVLSAVSITGERRAAMDFSLPYLNAGQVLVTAKGSRIGSTLDRFGGRRVGVQIGTTGAQEAARHRDVLVQAYDDAGLAMEDLSAGRIDAVVVDSPTAASYVLQNDRYRGRLAIAGRPFTREQYGIAVRKGDTRTLALVNRGLRGVLKNGTIDRLTGKWLN